MIRWAIYKLVILWRFAVTLVSLWQLQDSITMVNIRTMYCSIKKILLVFMKCRCISLVWFYHRIPVIFLHPQYAIELPNFLCDVIARLFSVLYDCYFWQGQWLHMNRSIQNISRIINLNGLILRSVDRASRYNRVKKTTWCKIILSIFRQSLHFSGISRPIIRRYNSLPLSLSLSLSLSIYIYI